jgi:translation elongation factor EF-G
MIETPSKLDEDAMEAYLEGEEPSFEKIQQLIRKGTSTVTSFRYSAVLHSKTKVYSRFWMQLLITCRLRLKFQPLRVSIRRPKAMVRVSL